MCKCFISSPNYFPLKANSEVTFELTELQVWNDSVVTGGWDDPFVTKAVTEKYRETPVNQFHKSW